MAEVLSTETKRVYKTVRTLEGIKCDICKRMVPAEKFKHPTCKYFKVVTGFHGLDDDGIENSSYQDVCPGCIEKFVSEYVKQAYGSKYIYVDTVYCHPRDVAE